MTEALSCIAATLARDGYAFARAPEMRLALEGLSDWEGFAASWDRLGLDTYMADGGRYRKRRHAAFSAARWGVLPLSSRWTQIGRAHV